ncbi:MAG: DUF4136 domain-containing protein [Spirochaetes bacterium]|nr:DUF4136 domain-containing protein [Spirochaetota bacterium]
MKKLSFFLLAGFILSACSSIKVTTDLDKTIDFSQYKTLEYWGWSEDSDKILNRFDKERIESAFGNEFKKRGIDLVEKGQGDMIVSLYIVTEKKTQKTATTTSMGGGYGGYYGHGPGYGWGGGHSTTEFHEYDYIVGTLVISIYDAEKKELIWESVGQGTVDEDPNSREESAEKNAAKIMKEFPVQPIQE